MKTKFIWTAMCLPLAFAACTNEEVFVEDNLAVLEGKKAVELKVAATYGTEGAESRMVNNNGTFLWDNTDVLGAVWNNTSGIFSNNRFTNSLAQASAQADFTTQATTVEGSYVFYYPYNTDVTKDLKSGIVYSLPEPQEYDPTGEKMMDNNFMISPNVTVDGNEPGELTLPLTLRSIYAYGTLNLTLPEVLVIDGSNVSSVNIQKIIISYNSNVKKNGKINISNVPTVNLSADYIKSLIDGTKESPSETEQSCKGKTEAEVRAILFAAADKGLTAQADNYADGEILDLTSGNTVISQVSITCVSDENPNGIALGKNETFTTRVLLPTTSESGSKVTLKVYTNRGVCTLLDATANDAETYRIKANHTANLADLNRETGATSFKMSYFTQMENTVYAVSEADFIASVKQFNNETVNVSVGDFPLTPAAIAAIPSNVHVNIINDVVFEGDMTLKEMTIKGSMATLKSGDIVLAEGFADKSVNGVYIKGANVTVASSTAELGNVWVYSGTLDIDAKNADGESAEITLPANEYDEKGNQISPAKALLAYGNADGTYGTINVNSKVNGRIKAISGGKVVVNADVEKLSVAKNCVAENYATVKVETNDGTINNFGTIVFENTNNGTINQKSENAKLTLKDNAESGVINTVAYSETTVTNQNLGEIIFAANARVSANGNVTYQAPADIKATDFSQLPTAITKIEFASDFTYNYGKDELTLATLQNNVKTLVFKGNLTLSQNWALNTGSTIQFIGAKADITGAKELSNVATILAGVPDDDATADVDESVATKVYIGTNTTIKTVSAVTLSGDATVWNDGKVYGTNNVTGGTWGGNVITTEPTSTGTQE